jgi:hypothetical protein
VRKGRVFGLWFHRDRVLCQNDPGLIEGQLCHESARQSGDPANGTRDCECRDGIGLDEPLARLVYREGFVDAPHRNHDVANESCLSGSITAVDELSGTGTESG